MKKSRIQLIGSLLFLLSSLAVWYQVVPNKQPEPVAPQREVVVAPQVEVAVADPVVGVWEQYSIQDGQRVFMARLDIRPECSGYTAYPLELSANTYPKHAYSSFDHRMEDGEWSFSEDWDHGEIGYFDLVKTGEGEYEGYATSSDGYQFRTVFVRVR